MINTFMLGINNADVNFEDGHIQAVSGFKDIYEYSDLHSPTPRRMVSSHRKMRWS